MARWIPDPSKVSSGEHIGRRLYDEPKLSGAPDQTPFGGLDIRHFIEDRDEQFSVDRLGQSDLNQKVVRYLKPRAEHHGTKFIPRRQFHGWAFMTGKQISDNSLIVEASGIKAKDGLGSELDWADSLIDENRFHAHLLIPQIQNLDIQTNATLFGYKVRDKFCKRVCSADGEILAAVLTTKADDSGNVA
jgi:hypothetical protein